MNMNVARETVKKLRLERGWTQEHLAHLAGVTARTIQRVEKTGFCDLETRSALASVFQIDLTQLDGEKKIEQTKSSEPNSQLYFHRISSGQGIVDVFAGSHAYRFSNEEPKTEEDAEYMSWVTSNIHDHSECWEDVEPGSRVKAAFELGSMVKELEAEGLWLFGLRTRSKSTMPSQDGEPALFEIKIANFHIAYANSGRITVLNPNNGPPSAAAELKR